MNTTVNGQQCYFDYEAWNKNRKYLEYRELLLNMVGLRGIIDPKVIEDANEHIFANYPQYTEFKD